MAELKRVVPSSKISNFRQVAPEAGGLFKNLALLAETAYEKLKPVAIEQMRQKGIDDGNEWVRRQIGDPTVGAPTDINAHAAAIRAIESSGNYKALGPVTKSGDRAYGAYQVMGANIGPWTEKYVGRRMTPDEFLADQKAQDTVFQGEFGSYVSQYGNPQDAASMWFSGKPLSKAGNASDGNTTVPEYVSRFNSHLGASDAPPTLVRTKDGNLEGRLYSPAAGEILAAHDAAAGVAYASGIMNKGIVDFMDMSSQFETNPDGFRQASKAYIDGIVSQAPDRFRDDVRSSLEQEAQKSWLGVLENHQRDIRERADNSSAALVDRWSSNLSEAIAAGNPEEIRRAHQELDGILKARESLPGIAWTPQQSQNVFIKAHDDGMKLRDSAASKAADTNKRKLETIIAAAKNGQHGADEAILEDPVIQAQHPDLWHDAVGAVAVRDYLPSFKSATPADQAAAIAEMKSHPITSDIQVAMTKAAETAHTASVKGWREDPIAQAQSSLENKPPALPDFSSPDATAVVNALTARRDYGKSLADAGYVQKPAFFSDAEASSIGAAFAKDADPATKLAIATAIAQGFGSDASIAFTELKINDPVTRYAGMMAAIGGDKEVAAGALHGQQLLAEGVVQPPSDTAIRSAVPEDISQALSSLPKDAQTTKDTLEFAKAIYANDAPRNLDPKSQEAIKLFQSSIQKALGQSTNRSGDQTGGIQDIGGHKVLLPIGVAGTDVSAAIGIAISGKSHLESNGRMVVTVNDGMNDGEAWKSASTQDIPMIGGQPITGDMFSKGYIRVVPYNGSLYRMEQVINGQATGDIRDPMGNIYFFDIKKLVDAALVHGTGQ